MNTQTIRAIGNSDGVIIPAHLLQKNGLKRGHKVAIEEIPNTKNLIIVTEPTKRKEKTAVTQEFQDWLNSFLEEDKEILDELAGR